jgi:hypothetical protein
MLTRRPIDALQFQGTDVILFYVNFKTIWDYIITAWNNENHKRTLSGNKPISVNGIKEECTRTPAYL